MVKFRIYSCYRVENNDIDIVKEGIIEDTHVFIPKEECSKTTSPQQDYFAKHKNTQEGATMSASALQRFEDRPRFGKAPFFRCD